MSANKKVCSFTHRKIWTILAHWTIYGASLSRKLRQPTNCAVDKSNHITSQTADLLGRLATGKVHQYMLSVLVDRGFLILSMFFVMRS